MDMTKENVERWYSMNEVCEYLAITRDTCLTWIAKRGMPGVKVGRIWRFKLSEIDEWMRSGEDKGDEDGQNENSASDNARPGSGSSPAEDR